MCGEFGHVTFGDVGGKKFPGLSRHFLLDPLEAFHQAADVVVAVAVVPNILDDLDNGSRYALGRLCRDARGFPEVLKEGTIEAVKDDKVRLVREVFAFPGAASHHLLKKDS